MRGPKTSFSVGVAVGRAVGWGVGALVGSGRTVIVGPGVGTAIVGPGVGTGSVTVGFGVGARVGDDVASVGRGVAVAVWSATRVGAAVAVAVAG